MSEAKEREHSKLPWIYVVANAQFGDVFGCDSAWEIGSDKVGGVAVVPGSQANAEFIVTACNSHDALVAACEAALENLELLGYRDDNAMRDQLRAALSLAKGEK